MRFIILCSIDGNEMNFTCIQINDNRLLNPILIGSQFFLTSSHQNLDEKNIDYLWHQMVQSPDFNPNFENPLLQEALTQYVSEEKEDSIEGKTLSFVPLGIIDIQGTYYILEPTIDALQRTGF